MIVILSGVSGVGKTTLAKMLEEHNFKRSISYTSRKKRENEIENEDYMFIHKEDFIRKIEEDFFLEHTKQFDNFYGTAYEQIENILSSGNKVIMCLTKEGFEAAKLKWPELVLGIYLMPPSPKTLAERLCERNAGENDLCQRMNAIEEKINSLEKEHEGYHHKIEPKSIEENFAELLELIKRFEKF